MIDEYQFEVGDLVTSYLYQGDMGIILKINDTRHHLFKYTVKWFKKGITGAYQEFEIYKIW